MREIEIFRVLREIVADLERVQEIERDPLASIFSYREGRERLAAAHEKTVGLAEMLRRDGLGETVQ